MKSILGTCILLVLIVPQAVADPNNYNRIIAFGDSLSDNGNFFHNTGSMPNPFPYYEGRFSNGPTWVELLSNPSKTSNPNSSMDRFWGGELTNFAGPYNTGAGVENVNAAVGGAAVTPGRSLNGAPAVPDQIDAFRNAGGTFARNDLAIVQGGGNDFFGPDPNPVDIGSHQLENVSKVIDGGARSILIVNLPNMGAIPFNNGDPNIASLALQATNVYNATLDQGVRSLAAAYRRVNLIQMDAFSAINLMIKSPSAFGFTNVTDACVLSQACVEANGQGYLFWDPVHPTARGHQLIARYAALLLSTEQTGKAVSALGQVALTTRLEASDIIFRRGLLPFGAMPSGLYVEAIGQTGSNDGSNTKQLGRTEFDFKLAGARAGFDASYGAISFGASLAYQAGAIDGQILQSDVSTTQVDVYALTHFAAFFVGAEAGLSWNKYNDIDRSTGFPTVNATGSMRGTDYSVSTTVGARHQFGAVTLTPAIRVGYASVNLDGFTEAAPILALEYDDRDILTGFWTARLRASAPLFNTKGTMIYGELGYEDLFSTSSDYSAKLAHNTAHAVTINDELLARGFFLKTGIVGNLNEKLKISGEYGLALQNGVGDVQWGRLRLTIPLEGDPSWNVR